MPGQTDRQTVRSCSHQSPREACSKPIEGNTADAFPEGEKHFVFEWKPEVLCLAAGDPGYRAGWETSLWLLLGETGEQKLQVCFAWPPQQQDLLLVSTSRPCHDPRLPLLWGGNFDVIELFTKGPGVCAMTTAILGAKKTLKTQHWLPASP